jgi:hypothetical protein
VFLFFSDLFHVLCALFFNFMHKITLSFKCFVLFCVWCLPGASIKVYIFFFPKYFVLVVCSFHLLLLVLIFCQSVLFKKITKYVFFLFFLWLFLILVFHFFFISIFFFIKKRDWLSRTEKSFYLLYILFNFNGFSTPCTLVGECWRTKKNHYHLCWKNQIYRLFCFCKLREFYVFKK